MPALVLAMAFAVAGCGARPDAGQSPPPGVLSIWGMAGRIDGAFVKPRVIDCLPDGKVFVIDRSGRVQFFDASGKFLSQFLLKNTEKGYPTGAAVTNDGRIWIAETHAYRVGVYSYDGTELLAFGGRGTDDGHFIYPTDIAIAPSGRVYVSDYGGAERVQEFDSSGRFVRLWGSEGSDPGQFRRPQALVVTPDGSLFVADSCNDRIQKFSPDGAVIGVYGKAGSGEGELSYPYDLAVGPDGMIYICEYGNCRVQRMTQDGRFCGTWGRRGSAPGELAQPWAVAVDKANRLFIVDTGNSRIVVIDPARAQWSVVLKGSTSV